jgi:hypothetical protein
VAYANHPDLVITHKYYLDMISWAEHDPTAKITPAFPCSMNKGTFEAHCNRAKLPARIYVNDALMLALSRGHMKQVSLRLFLPLWASQIQQFVNVLLR